MPKVVIYTRFSPRPNAKDCDSCEKQYERCQIYADSKKYSWHIDDVYHEKATSGNSLDSRPELLKAIVSLNEGDVLLVASNDRLARDSLAYLMIQEAVRDRGATIEFADGSPPATTPEGVLFQSILAAFATYQRSVTKQRTSVGVKKALEKRKKDGKHQGKAPFGYEWKRGEIQECTREQEILKRIKRIVDPQSTEMMRSNYEIADLINEEWGGLRHKPATASAIRKLIKRHGFAVRIH